MSENFLQHARKLKPRAILVSLSILFFIKYDYVFIHNICFYSFFGGSLYFVSAPCLQSRVLRLGSQDLAVILWIGNTECSFETLFQTSASQVSSVSVLFSYFDCLSPQILCKEYRKRGSLYCIACLIINTVNAFFFPVKTAFDFNSEI